MLPAAAVTASERTKRAVSQSERTFDNAEPEKGGLWVALSRFAIPLFTSIYHGVLFVYAIVIIYQ